MPLQPMPLTSPTAFVALPRPARALGLAVLAAVLLAAAGGCQFGPSVQRQQLIQHQALIDFSGLKPSEAVEAVRVQASPPASWVLHGVERHALYNHQQWKSPTARTAVGVIYARMPLPLSADTLLWLGRQQYTKQADDGKEVSNWTDSVGRRWFEAETKKYHAGGTRSSTGWTPGSCTWGTRRMPPPSRPTSAWPPGASRCSCRSSRGERFTVPLSTQKVTPVTESAGAKGGGSPATNPSAATGCRPPRCRPPRRGNKLPHDLTWRPSARPSPATAVAGL
jgi:hypothetical protein